MNIALNEIIAVRHPYLNPGPPPQRPTNGHERDYHYLIHIKYRACHVSV